MMPDAADIVIAGRTAGGGWVRSEWERRTKGWDHYEISRRAQDAAMMHSDVAPACAEPTARHGDVRGSATRREAQGDSGRPAGEPFVLPVRARMRAVRLVGRVERRRSGMHELPQEQRS